MAEPNRRRKFVSTSLSKSGTNPRLETGQFGAKAAALFAGARIFRLLHVSKSLALPMLTKKA